MTWPPAPDAPLDPHIRAFFDDMADHPDDPAVRFVFADWLAERDDPRAELLRIQGEYRQALASDADTKPLKERAEAWADRYVPEWFGQKPPGSLWLEAPGLEVMGYNSTDILDTAPFQGLQQALGEGWIGFFRMTFWLDAQVRKAGDLGLLSGPAELDFLGGQLRDDSFAVLPGLSRLRRLSIGGSDAGVTDNLLLHLTGLTALRELSLWSLDNFTGSRLGHLSGLTELRRLSLYNCQQVDDRVLRLLVAFRRLEELTVSRCEPLTGAALVHLAELPTLRELDLSDNPQLDDNALAHLAPLTGLRRLNLSCCPRITDAGLAHLAGLTNLESLNLFSATQLTGAGVAHLRGLTRLKFLSLIGVKLKPHETRALRKALPGCEVVRK
jgi:uncharacterized protein (TIGR02996 family)